jgi:hypothetical protein
MRQLLLFVLLVLTAACSASSEGDDALLDPSRLSPRDPRALCAPGRWCWVEGEPFSAMHGLTPDGVVAMSARGEVWRWTDTGWVSLEFPVWLSERSLFASGPDDVWVAGDGRLLHHDGVQWTELSAAASGAPSGRWPSTLVGSGATNVWAYDTGGSAHSPGRSRMMMHFDGRQWSAHPAGPGQTAMDLLPISATETWALTVTEPAMPFLALRFDGAEWTTQGRLGRW